MRKDEGDIKGAGEFGYQLKASRKAMAGVVRNKVKKKEQNRGQEKTGVKM